MKIVTFDRIAGSAVIVSIVFACIVAITSWEWFPTPGDWGDIARVPKSITNYMALLLPPVVILLCLLARRWYSTKP